MDLGVMKAQEFRNMCLFFVPIIIDCIPSSFKKEIQLWLHIWFMIRSCIIPNCEFEHVANHEIDHSWQQFYKLFEETHGKTNCTYSIHVVASHLLDIRGKQPLTERSSFSFDNFFSEICSMYHPGTVSSLKQILQNCYMKRILQRHYCTSVIKYLPKPNKPTRECNHLVYVYNEGKYSIYSIITPHYQMQKYYLCNCLLYTSPSPRD